VHAKLIPTAERQRERSIELKFLFYSSVRVWALLAVLAAPISATNCSSSENNQTGAGGTGTQEGTGGTSSTSSTVFTLLAKSVGRFFVKLNSTDPANTIVSGVVKSGADPNSYVETPVSTAGGCTLFKLSAPSCANANNGDGCDTSAEVCTGTDTCTKRPTNKNVGVVRVTGVETNTGTNSFELMNVSNSYNTPGDVLLTYPGISEGNAIKVSAAGADVPAFEVTAKGIGPLALGSASYQISTTAPLTVTWTVPNLSGDSRIQATVNVSHHGGSKGYIACDVADSGSLAISAEQIAGLINMGVAGYPTLTVVRRATGTAAIAAGQVVLSVESSVSPAFSVQGYISCLGDETVSPCGAGQSCNVDLKLCQ